MNHSHSTIYRICLLAVVILTIAGGIFYYVNYVKSQTTVTEGTLVQSEEFKTQDSAVTREAPEQPEESETRDSQEEYTQEAVEEEAVESFKPSASPIKCT